MHIRSHHRRFYAVFFCFLFLFFLLSLRLIFIYSFRSKYLITLAEKQHNFFTELEPRRGTIFDKNFRPQALNIACDSLYAMPLKIKNKQISAEKLHQILGLESNYILERISRNKSFIWISRKLSPDKIKKIEEENIKGLGFLRESKRCYPNKELSSHLLGFAGIDNSGLEGLELAYDRYLRGEPGWLRSMRDAKQRTVPIYEKFIPARDGYDLVLTIDEVIQFIAEYELDRVYKESRAKSAIIIIMDPYTGGILALANRPALDLNNVGAYNKEDRRNRAVTDYFEPGSVFKIVTASAALEEGRVSLDDKFFCENGEYRVGNHVLHDHTPHAWLSFLKVISESSNIGTTKVAQMLGPDIIYRYARRFGFGDFTGVDMPGEVQGVLKLPSSWSKTSIGAIPIGQEVCVTALQLVNMVSAIANNGLLYKPYVVSEIRDKAGEIIKKFQPQVLRRVISEETAYKMKQILADVVAEGTGRLARLSNFEVAGKTGTAQKIENGTYSHTSFIATFLGFVPVENPRIAMVVIVDDPKGTHFGGTVSAPVFKRVADKVLKYLNASENLEIVRHEIK
ncbi:MAG: hypothetical protein COV72_09180 [Candidatus Omnitrophica bacterium CG11_big_fil_rev_8_21_14_0_20_42_13]|uniref:Penicillin-binding protein n=1 Tax=Candidatus Ghiorseimicrobium undicola TaxID=1974746 RepID=A0A2H0LXR9_9BACT|nr:MAG: hypothetical protein COV72_09180 [Candidatus Omnitrophica bacterium CG11_big_fil_rev_8_21_14_0_20_42_13]